MIGGFMNLIRGITSLFISSYQEFSIEKSMIKKLYSWKDHRKRRGKKYTSTTNEELDQHMDAN
jgi:hypothetical protein